MINHYRTSLLNINGNNWPGLQYPGEELVDPSFRGKKLPTHISTVRRIMLGEAPDRAYLNYRLRQLTTLWHDSILHEAATDLDSRLTYWPNKYASDMSSYGSVSVDAINSQVIPNFSYFKTPEADDKQGRAEFIYELSVSGDTCQLTDEKTKQSTVINKSGSYFNLGNNILISIGNGNWRVVSYGIPKKDLGEVLVDCDLIKNSEVEFLLFLDNPSLKEVWKSSDFLPERLGALSLALAIEMSKLTEVKVI